MVFDTDGNVNCYKADGSKIRGGSYELDMYSDGRNASVVVLDDRCREIASINTELTSPYVDIDRGRINLLCQSAVSSYNYKGSLLKQAEVPADCQEVFSSQGRLLANGFMYLTEVE